MQSNYTVFSMVDAALAGKRNVEQEPVSGAEAEIIEQAVDKAQMSKVSSGDAAER